MQEIEEIYWNLLKDGYTQKDAAKEAQARTGYSMVTKKPIKQRGPLHKTNKDWKYGEY